jgi:hypothetical protein
LLLAGEFVVEATWRGGIGRPGAAMARARRWMPCAARALHAEDLDATEEIHDLGDEMARITLRRKPNRRQPSVDRYVRRG